MKKSTKWLIFFLLLALIGCRPDRSASRSPEPAVTVQKTGEDLITLTAEPAADQWVVPTPTVVETTEAALPSADTREVSSHFGVELHDFSTLSKAEGFDNHWLRYNALLWSAYQPNHASQFLVDHELEANMIAVSEAGMKLILIVRSTPTWAQKYDGYYCGPIAEDHFDDFAAFMAQLVTKYSVDPYNVKYYELWNEPDESLDTVYAPDAVLGCWGDKEDDYFGGGFYGEMLKKVYPAVKGANPNAQLVLGGLVLPCQPGQHPYCDMTKFFDGILQVGGGAYFDYVSFHSYTTYDPGQPSVIQMEKNEHWWASSGGMVEGKVAYLEAVLADYGVEKPILLTETALIDLNNHAPDDLDAFEQDKADYLVWLMIRNIARGIEGTCWYHLDQYGWNKGGLLDRDNEPLPVYAAYQFLAATLGEAVFQGELNLGEGIRGFAFIRDAQSVWVLFSEVGDQRVIDVPDVVLTVYDLFGGSISPSDGKVTFDRPIYIVLDD